MVQAAPAGEAGLWREARRLMANEWELDVPLSGLVDACLAAVATVGPLTTMVGTDERGRDGHFHLYYTFSDDAGDRFLCLRARIPAAAPAFPSVASRVPAADWYEREVRDLLGLVPEGHPDPRPLVAHGDWPTGFHPLRKDAAASERPPRAAGRVWHPLPAAGRGIHEVPVGPIHAGIIEPGHFRFQTVGENVARLDARLFYTHRGIEKLAEGLTAFEAIPLVERICGVCSVANAVAYCHAVERLAGAAPPPRAAWLRTLLLEFERLYNHVGDLGNICGGAGFAFGTSQWAYLKERLMAACEQVAGHRYLRGLLQPGGLRRDLPADAFRELERLSAALPAEIEQLAAIVLDQDSLLDRFRGSGVLKPEVARAMGTVGVTARASGVARDCRQMHPHAAYGRLDCTPALESAGDVLARYRVRVREALASLRHIDHLLAGLPPGPVWVPLPPLPPFAHALGYAESARGEDVHWVMTGVRGEICRYRIRSASFANWPVVPLTVPGNIVPDFPLINKSFELCYACLDR